MAEGVFTKVVEKAGTRNRYRIDSAGTGDWHIGEPPDRRAQQATRLRGIDISHLAARRVTPEDFHDFDLIIAMDRDNLRNLHALAPQGREDKVTLFLDYAPELGEREVPDPYYGGEHGFTHVLNLVERASYGLLAKLEGERPCANGESGIG